MFNTYSKRKYLVETFDYVTPLWPKPLKDAELLTVGAARLIQKGESNGFSYPDLIGESDGFLKTTACPLQEVTLVVTLAMVSCLLMLLGGLLSAPTPLMESMYQRLRNFRTT